jgi:hypothetical protein
MNKPADHPEPEPNVSDAIQKFLAQAGDVAKKTYEEFSDYAKAVADPLDQLTVQAKDVAGQAPDHELLIQGAKAFTDAGAIFFQVANRALYANAEAARGPGGVASESAKFFRQLGMLWLDSTVGEGTATTGFTGTDRIREVEFRDVAAGEPTGRTISIVSRAGEEADGELVRSDLMGSSGARIPAENIKLFDGHSNPIEHRTSVAPGRTPISIVVEVPGDAEPGRYRGLLSVYAGGVESSLVLTVVVTGART